MKMYGFWRSAASFRVRIALNLKAIPLTETMIDLDAGTQTQPEFLAINPAGAVPALFDDDGTALYQSLAILEYLEETHPTPPLLPPTPRERARVRALALIWAADHHPLIVPRVRNYLTRELGVSDAQRLTWIRHWFTTGLGVGETRLAGAAETGIYCHGENITIADLCLASQVAGAMGAGVEISQFPTIARIYATCMQIDAFARAHPLRQPGAPSQH